MILARVPASPGRRRRKDYHALLGALRARPNVFARLEEAGLATLVAGDDLPPFWARRTDRALYLFFAHPDAREVRYPIRYGQSLNPRRQSRRAIIDLDGERVPIDLVFEPNQSLLVRVSPDEGARFVDIAYRPPRPTRMA